MCLWTNWEDAFRRSAPAWVSLVAQCRGQDFQTSLVTAGFSSLSLESWMVSTYRASSTGYCTGWGDPHFVTFDGLYYSYQGNCSYVLMEEITPTVDNFGVYIDNYHCDVSDDVSCPRTLIVRHETQEVQIRTLQLMPIVVQVCGWDWLGSQMCLSWPHTVGPRRQRIRLRIRQTRLDPWHIRASLGSCQLFSWAL